jgi:hypothetical protein
MQKFKTIVSIIAIAVMMFATVGCKTAIPPVQTQHDSIYVAKTITVRDTVFKTAPASVSVSVSVDSLFKPGLNPISRQVKNARITMHQKAGIITASCDCDSLEIKARLQDVYEKEFRQKTSELIQYLPSGSDKPPSFMMFLIWSGAIFWMALIGYLIYLIARK